jgi:hypothetical protein
MNPGGNSQARQFIPRTSMPMVCGAKATKNQTPEWCSTNNSPGSFAAPA